METRKCVAEGYNRQLLAQSYGPMIDTNGQACFRTVLGKKLYRKVNWIMLLDAYGRDVKICYPEGGDDSVYSIFENETLELLVQITSKQRRTKEYTLWEKKYYKK